MEHNKENIIRLLTAMRDNKAALREKHTEFADMYLTEKIFADQIIMIIKNKEYFEDLCSIYEVEDEK